MDWSDTVLIPAIISGVSILILCCQIFNTFVRKQTQSRDSLLHDDGLGSNQTEESREPSCETFVDLSYARLDGGTAIFTWRLLQLLGNLFLVLLTILSALGPREAVAQERSQLASLAIYVSRKVIFAAYSLISLY